MKAGFLLLFLFFFALIFTPSARSQSNNTGAELPDSVREKEHSPTKATLMSTFVPGLGQIYNKKYWKLPIIYTGFGVMTYFIVFNTDLYMDYKCAYIESSNGDLNGNYADLVNKYTKDELLSAREYYRRNLEISCLITALWYILNIVDAAVDAHLYTFNISEKLSLNLGPSVQSYGYRNQPATGLKIKLKF
jgi:hypothetical protein